METDSRLYHMGRISEGKYCRGDYGQHYSYGQHYIASVQKLNPQISMLLSSKPQRIDVVSNSQYWFVFVAFHGFSVLIPFRCFSYSSDAFQCSKATFSLLFVTFYVFHCFSKLWGCLRLWHTGRRQVGGRLPAGRRQAAGWRALFWGIAGATGAEQA